MGLRQIGTGINLAIRLQFGVPILVLTLTSALLCVLDAVWPQVVGERDLDEVLLAVTILFFADIPALKWSAMWSAMRFPSSSRALVRSGLLVLATPGFLILGLGVLSALYEFLFPRGDLRLFPRDPLPFYVAFSLIVDAAAFAACRWLFLNRLRTLAAHNFDAASAEAERLAKSAKRGATGPRHWRVPWPKTWRWRAIAIAGLAFALLVGSWGARILWLRRAVETRARTIGLNQDPQRASAVPRAGDAPFRWTLPLSANLMKLAALIQGPGAIPGLDHQTMLRFISDEQGLTPGSAGRGAPADEAFERRQSGIIRTNVALMIGANAKALALVRDPEFAIASERGSMETLDSFQLSKLNDLRALILAEGHHQIAEGNAEGAARAVCRLLEGTSDLQGRGEAAAQAGLRRAAGFLLSAQLVVEEAARRGLLDDAFSEKVLAALPQAPLLDAASCGVDHGSLQIFYDYFHQFWNTMQPAVLGMRPKEKFRMRLALFSGQLEKTVLDSFDAAERLRPIVSSRPFDSAAFQALRQEAERTALDRGRSVFPFFGDVELSFCLPSGKSIWTLSRGIGFSEALSPSKPFCANTGRRRRPSKTSRPTP